MSLTPKQEKFCECIVSGMSGKDSYMTAYNSKSDNAAMVESTKLLARDDINERLKELRKPIESLLQTQAINEYERVKRVAWERVQECIAAGDDNAIARYLDIINKMNGTYVNINKNIEENSTDIQELDTGTLLKLVQ